MFEKEAKEYADKVYENRTEMDHYGIADAFQAGAEFGYNKAKEEMQENGLALQSDMDKTIEQNLQLKKELNKANEWHYVKDGNLPKEDDVYLVYTTKGVLLGHYEQGGADGETNFRGEPYSDFTEYPSETLFTEDEIIAWKEIVLPKESKENEL